MCLSVCVCLWEESGVSGGGERSVGVSKNNRDFKMTRMPHLECHMTHFGEAFDTLGVSQNNGDFRMTRMTQPECHMTHLGESCDTLGVSCGVTLIETSLYFQGESCDTLGVSCGSLCTIKTFLYYFQSASCDTLGLSCGVTLHNTEVPSLFPDCG